MSLLSSLFGSGGSSSSSTSSNSNATNTAYETDKRAVASDQAVSLTGDGNTVDRSTSNVTSFMDTSNRSTTDLTSFLDQSNRSTTSSTAFADSSNRSTAFTDNSNRSSVTTDAGSIAGALGLANSALGLGDSMTTKAFGVAGDTIAGALDVLKLTAKNNADATSRAFDLATAASNNVTKSSADVLGFSGNAIATTADSFSTAKAPDSKMVMAVVAAVAVIGVALALK